MAKLLSVCGKCSIAFENNAFLFPEGASIEFSNVTVDVPCPKCRNRTVTLYEGTYQAIGGIVQFLQDPARNVTELRRLSEILREAKDKKQNPTEISKILDKELPSFELLANFFSKHAHSIAAVATIATILGLLLTSIQTAISYKQLIESREQKPNAPTTIINQIINYSAPNKETKEKSALQEPKTRFTTGKKRVGVNAPCECGSGKKRKKCHRQ